MVHQVEACSVISEAAVEAEFEIHAFLDAWSGTKGRAPEEQYAGIRSQMTAFNAAYRKHRLFLSDRQTSAAGDLQDILMSAAGLAGGKIKDPPSRIDVGFSDVLGEAMFGAIQNFRGACRSEIIGKE